MSPLPPLPDPSAPPPLVAAGPWRRCAARFADSLILALPTAVLYSALGGEQTGLLGSPRSAASLVATIVVSAVHLAYAAGLESSRGATLGKQLVRIHTVGPDGRHPEPAAAVQRNSWLMLSAVPVIGAGLQAAAMLAIWATMASDPFKRGWHDRAAGGTAVVLDR